MLNTNKYNSIEVKSQELLSLFNVFQREDKIKVLEGLLALASQKRIIPFQFEAKKNLFKKQPMIAWTDGKCDTTEMKNWLDCVLWNYKINTQYQGVALVLDEWDLAVIDIDNIERFSQSVMNIDEFLNEISQSALMIEKSLRKGYHIFIERSYLLEKLNNEFPNNKKLLESYGFEVRHKGLLICYPSAYIKDEHNFQTKIVSVNINDRKETEALLKIVELAKTKIDKKVERRTEAKIEERTEETEKTEEKIEERTEKIEKNDIVKVKITNEVIQQIKERAKFSDFLSPAHTYTNYQTYNCPFHPPDKTPSFTVYENQEGEYAIDLHDDRRYDIISFYQELYRCDFITAIKELSDKYNIELEIIENKEEKKEQEEQENQEEDEQEKYWIQKFIERFGNILDRFPMKDTENDGVRWLFKKGKLIGLKNGGNKQKIIIEKEFFLVTHVIKDIQEKVMAYRIKTISGEIFDIPIASISEIETILTSQKIFVGAGKGKLLSSYIASYTEQYKYEIPSIIMLDSIGWYKDNYYLPQISGDNIEIKNQKGYGSKGDKQKELTMMKKLMNSHLGLGYVIAFASTLLYPLDTKNVVVYIQGANGRGKTTITNIGLSLWGEYDKLGQSANSTRTGKEISIATKKDRIILLDELNTSSNKDKYSEVATLIYEFSAGEGKERATKYLELKEKMTYRGILVITAELDFDTLLEKATGNVNGAVRRSIFVDMSLFREIEKEMFTEIYDSISNHYGNIIKDWINFLKKKDRKDIKNIFKAYIDICSSNGLRNGMDRNFALLYTTLELMKECFGVETEEMKKIIERIAKDNTDLLSKRSVFTKEMIEELVNDFIQENVNKGILYEKKGEGNNAVISLEQKNIVELYFIQAPPPRLGFYFTTTGLKKVAEKGGLTEKELKKLLAQYNMCEADKDRILKRTSVRYKEMSIKVYFIQIEQTDIEKMFGELEDLDVML